MANYYIPSRNVGRSATYEMARIEKERERGRYSTFLEHMKTFYLSEALYCILGKCVNEGTEIMPTFGREVCRSFVKEEGYESLMRKFRTGTHTLAMVASAVEEACSSTSKKVNKENELSFVIQDTDRDKFYDDLRKLPTDEVCKKVTERVCNAAEEFVQRNITKKADIEAIAAKTKERIDAAKAKYDEKMAEQVQKEQMAMYKREVNRIRNSSPTRNIYEHMMNITSDAILNSGDEIRENYLSESGRFDLSKVEDRVRVMYTFLEMVNSMKMKKVDNKYITECLASIA